MCKRESGKRREKEIEIEKEREGERERERQIVKSREGLDRSITQFHLWNKMITIKN